MPKWRGWPWVGGGTVHQRNDWKRCEGVEVPVGGGFPDCYFLSEIGSKVKVTS